MLTNCSGSSSCLLSTSNRYVCGFRPWPASACLSQPRPATAAPTGPHPFAPTAMIACNWRGRPFRLHYSDCNSSWTEASCDLSNWPRLCRNSARVQIFNVPRRAPPVWPARRPKLASLSLSLSLTWPDSPAGSILTSPFRWGQPAKGKRNSSTPATTTTTTTVVIGGQQRIMITI